jgi:sugar phosphate isomerase/epimerase
VNFDPSNCVVCGEDPIALLEVVKSRVVTMHASDRYFEGGTLADLQRIDQDPRAGYATILKHGVIGRGLNDYDRIFSILRGAGFDGWISIEDGADPRTSAADIRESAVFLRRKLAEHGLGGSSRFGRPSAQKESRGSPW